VRLPQVLAVLVTTVEALDPVAVTAQMRALKLALIGEVHLVVAPEIDSLFEGFIAAVAGVWSSQEMVLILNRSAVGRSRSWGPDVGSSHVR